MLHFFQPHGRFVRHYDCLQVGTVSTLTPQQTVSSEHSIQSLAEPYLTFGLDSFLQIWSLMEEGALQDTEICFKCCFFSNIHYMTLFICMESVT